MICHNLWSHVGFRLNVPMMEVQENHKKKTQLNLGFFLLYYCFSFPGGC